MDSLEILTTSSKPKPMYWIESVDNNGQFHSTLVLPSENYFGVGEQLVFEQDHQIYKVLDQKGKDHSRFLFHHLQELEQRR